jgi:hypothetical protein
MQSRVGMFVFAGVVMVRRVFGLTTEMAVGRVERQGNGATSDQICRKSGLLSRRGLRYAGSGGNPIE